MTSNLSALQLVSGPSASENIEKIKALVADLAPQKNQLLLLPENALCVADKNHYLKLAEALGDGPFQNQLSAIAKQYHCYLICGSFPIKSTIKNKIHTTSLVFSPNGQLISHYHKIHLFDALVDDKQGAYKESDTFESGASLHVFDWQTDHGTFKVGLSICYDLRFPGLFQALRAQGADIILVAAAFTYVTGKAHWLPLLQARAIENQCYVIAANQGGRHQCMRESHIEPKVDIQAESHVESYGHSMIISPWGDILDEHKCNEGFVCASFSKTVIDDLRASMPISTHNRFTSVLK